MGALVELGLGARQIGLAVRRGELTQTSGALDGVDTPEHDLTGGLIALGVPVAHARAFGGDFERCRTIVTAEPDDRVEDAVIALQRGGAVSVLTWSPHASPAAQ